MEILKNEQLQIVVSEHGAELQSILDAEGKEYLWQGDSKYWGRRSPILFPIVCGLWDDCYRLDGYEYKMARHGFARDLEWKCIAQSADSASFELTQSEETLYRFPYTFSVRSDYQLTEKGINWKITVKNTGDKEFSFGVGTHAAFSMNGSPVKSVRVYRSTPEEPELVFTAFEKTPAEETQTDNNANTGK